MEPKAAPEKDEKIRESRRCRSSGGAGDEDADEAQRRSKRSKPQTRHPSSPHRRARDYRQEEEHRDRGDHGAMSHRSHHHHRYKDDSSQYDDYGDRRLYHDANDRSSRRHDDSSSHRRHDDGSSHRRHDEGSSRRHDDSSSHRRHDEGSSRPHDEGSSHRRDDEGSSHRRHNDSPPEETPGDRNHGGLDGGKHGPQETGHNVSEPLSQEPSVQPQACLVLDNLFDKCVVEPFNDSLKMDSVLLEDIKADAHEMCATKGGTVTNIGVDPYAGLVYVLFRDASFAEAAKKALDGKYYYNERLIKATYIDPSECRRKFTN